MDGNLSKIRFGSKKTYSLKLNYSGFLKIQKYFVISDKDNNSTFLFRYSTKDGKMWSIFIRKRQGTDYYLIYGVCGDYSFGSIPFGYKSSLSGNLKAAKEIYKWFIDNYKLNITDLVEVEKFKMKLSLVL